MGPAAAVRDGGWKAEGAGGAQQVGDLGRLDKRHAAEGCGSGHDHALDGPLGCEPRVERPRQQRIVVARRRGKGSHLLEGRGRGLQLDGQARSRLRPGRAR